MLFHVAPRVTPRGLSIKQEALYRLILVGPQRVLKDAEQVASWSTSNTSNPDPAITIKETREFPIRSNAGIDYVGVAGCVFVDVREASRRVRITRTDTVMIC